MLVVYKLRNGEKMVGLGEVISRKSNSSASPWDLTPWVVSQDKDNRVLPFCEIVKGFGGPNIQASSED